MFERVFIVAEAGANHNGSLQTALELVEEACRAGADAVKFQDYTLETLFAPEQYEKTLGITDPSWRGEVRRLRFPREWRRAVHHRARELGISCFYTPFSPRAVGEVEPLVPFYKVASGDITNIPLLERIAATGKGVFLLTGASELPEIERAVETLRAGAPPFLCIMHCVMLYPPPEDALHLSFLTSLQEHFNLPVGFSDHTPGLEAAAAAVARGAVALEKHFTLDRGQPGGDHALSLDPRGFARLVHRVRRTERMLGPGRRSITPREAAERVYARRGLYAARDLAAGTTLAAGDLTALRPNAFLGAERIREVTGKVLAADLPRGRPLQEHMLRDPGPGEGA
jgi:sialic acid synthase SpsE